MLGLSLHYRPSRDRLDASAWAVSLSSSEAVSAGLQEVTKSPFCFCFWGRAFGSCSGRFIGGCSPCGRIWNIWQSGMTQTDNWCLRITEPRGVRSLPLYLMQLSFVLSLSAHNMGCHTDESESWAGKCLAAVPSCGSRWVVKLGWSSSRTTAMMEVFGDLNCVKTHLRSCGLNVQRQKTKTWQTSRREGFQSSLRSSGPKCLSQILVWGLSFSAGPFEALSLRGEWEDRR